MSAVSVTIDAPLQTLNTLRVAARARYLVQIGEAGELDHVLQNPQFAALPILTLGDGSNVLLTGDFDGVVLQLEASGVEIITNSDQEVIVRAEAGLNWDALVSWSLQQGLGGIENLALIPGRCGAAPIQNIGAYGVEFSDVAVAVEVFDRDARTHRVVAAADCGFGYRDSLFKRMPHRFVVTAVQLKLRRRPELNLDYAGIREALDSLKIAQPCPSDIAEVVRGLRRRKLPQPELLPNAGSFFKNPVVDAGTAEALLSAHVDLPHWKLADSRQCKLSAAWLIEKSGMKGLRQGDAGIAAQHALVLVNHGAASGHELLAFARFVQQAVLDRFGVTLEIEPVVIPGAIR